ncbi:MAG: hypothetical protein WA655_16185 [Candidatus Korobacteraceae bacterium]
MKTKMVLIACLLALALSASAETLTFGGLPLAKSPSAVPNGYGSLDWSRFSYVDPAWANAGPGFKRGPNALDVAFMGGGTCEISAVSCSASISSGASMANAIGAAFVVKSAIVAAGYHTEIINVAAYNHGVSVGSQTYKLTTSLQQITFPNWGAITQLVIDTEQGTVVFYDLDMQLVAAHAASSASATRPSAIPGPSSEGGRKQAEKVAANAVPGASAEGDNSATARRPTAVPGPSAEHTRVDASAEN